RDEPRSSARPSAGDREPAESASRARPTRRPQPGPAPSQVPRGGFRERPAPKAPKASSRAQPRAPIGPLIKVIRHLAELSDTPVSHDDIIDRCKAALSDPDAARRVLEELRVIDDRDPGSD